uniref:Methyltransferase-like protein 13 n=1 Tax=Acrobeloides nanus TaxID=290746 RepID=A0A914CHS0_9BILA
MIQLSRRFHLSRSISRKFRFLICLILLIILTKLYYEYVPQWEYDESHPELISTGDPDKVAIDKMCSPTSHSCYSVIDLFDKSGRVRRAIYTHGFEKDFESMVALVSPKGLPAKESDTRIWEVDHREILSQYVAAMILEPLMLAAIGIEHERDESTSLLVIGLGGGSLDMFFHKQKPKMNITVIEIDTLVNNLAHRWFGIEENEHRRTIIADGVEFMYKASIEGQKFDAVFIDACDTTREMPCPAKVFLEEKVLENAKSLLKTMGALIVNVLPLIDEDENVGKVKQKLLSKFPTCLSMVMSSELNTVFACVNYSLEKENRKSTYELIQHRFQTLVLRYNLHALMKDVQFTLLN